MPNSTFNLERRRTIGAFGALAASTLTASWAADVAFDHTHAAWTALLRKHVVLINRATGSQVRYAAMRTDRPALRAYLETLSAISRASFETFSREQQMAFLINAYNAYTVDLILTRYPDLKSIKDLGSVLTSPWKLKFIPLLGAKMSLDGIEHDTLRQRGRYDDPRVHFAVNCASIGCPMLREEAYVATRLDEQLEGQVSRFLSDRSRNRFDAATKRLEVSKIFNWYSEDFSVGHRGIDSLSIFFARYADRLADAPADRAMIRNERLELAYLEYDWRLNDIR